MNTSSFSFGGECGRVRGIFLIECLVYIGVLFILLGIATVALFRGMEHSAALRRNADDITAALHIGERWRADIRAATGTIRAETDGEAAILHIPRGSEEIVYRFADHAIDRRVGAGIWSRLLPNVAASAMTLEVRPRVTAWRWELELQHRAKGPHLRPLFTFLSTPQPVVAP